MIDNDVLSRLSPYQYIINTSRGAVVNCSDLRNALAEGAIAGAVLDVWEGEPHIDYELLDLLALGTAHIAGFSLDGKVRATEMILEALCRFCAKPIPWDARTVLPDPATIRPASGLDGTAAIRSLVQQAYDIRRDAEYLRQSKALPPDDAARRFDEIRTQYALRPEFRHYRVADSSDEIAAPLRQLGFQIPR
jgi:erythronate-4-phosphate dehydrogenase